MCGIWVDDQLHRDRREALVDDLEAHHLVGVAHRFVHRGRRHFHLERDVGAELVVQNWSAVGDRLFRIDHRVERVVVHVDQVERILRAVGVGGDRDHHRLADVTHLADRERGMEWDSLGRCHARQRADLVLDVLAGQQADHARRATRCRQVDGIYFRVRVRAAQYDRRQHPRQPDVVDVDALALDEPRVLAPLDALAHELRDHRHRLLLLWIHARAVRERCQAATLPERILLAAYWTALMMCW